MLTDAQTFPNVYAPEMTELGGNQNSVLGMEGQQHLTLRADLHAQFKPGDLEEIARLTRDHATALVEASGGRIDVMRDFVTRCATEVCCTYLGVSPSDPDTFAEWTMAVSAMLFGDPFGDANTRRQGTNRRGASARHVRRRDRAGRGQTTPRIGTVHRAHVTLVDRYVSNSKMPAELVRASLLGLATALIPTNTLACGNILEQLLGDRTLMAAARKAAEKGDKAALETALLQAARLNPALSPGQWRDGRARWRDRAGNVAGAARPRRRRRPRRGHVGAPRRARRAGGAEGSEACGMADVRRRAACVPSAPRSR